jgi:hypothetical protein
MLKQDTMVLLGSEYMARFMLSLTDFYTDVRYTSRDPHKNLRWVPPKHRVRFDLAQPDTWSNVPPGGDLLWCFPAVPLNSVQQFAARIKGSFRKLVNHACRGKNFYERNVERSYCACRVYMDRTAIRSTGSERAASALRESM